VVLRDGGGVWRIGIDRMADFEKGLLCGSVIPAPWEIITVDRSVFSWAGMIFKHIEIASQAECQCLKTKFMSRPTTSHSPESTKCRFDSAQRPPSPLRKLQ